MKIKIVKIYRRHRTHGPWQKSHPEIGSAKNKKSQVIGQCASHNMSRFGNFTRINVHNLSDL